MQLHLIVPSCGAQPMLEKMLTSLAEHTTPCHLVVVINHSAGWRHAAVCSQVECLRDNGWRVTLVDVAQQIGYVRAVNLGWRVLEAVPDDYVAVLNDDVVFQGPWTGPLMEALNAGATLVGPSLRTVGADGLWGGPQDPPYIEGWCLMVRKDHAEGGLRPGETSEWIFDPQFAPQLCEDMDLGLWAARNQPSLIRQIDIPIQHIRHATVDPQTQPETARVWEENRRKLIAKWGLGARPIPQSPPSVVSGAGSVVWPQSLKHYLQARANQTGESFDLDDGSIIAPEPSAPPHGSAPEECATRSALLADSPGPQSVVRSCSLRDGLQARANRTGDSFELPNGTTIAPELAGPLPTSPSPLPTQAAQKNWQIVP